MGPSGDATRPGFIVVKRKTRSGGSLRGKLARVLAGGIGLPDFERGVGHNVAIAIEDFAANGDALSGDALRHEIFAFEVKQTEAKERADGLGCGWGRRPPVIAGGTHRVASTGVA
jgi:hypothetical protein